MKDILYNLALSDTTNFCIHNGIDCSGSYLVKDGRGFTYNLVRYSDNKTLVTVTFHKAQVPTHTYAFDEIQ